MQRPYSSLRRVLNCQRCGKEYVTYAKISKWCSNACKWVDARTKFFEHINKNGPNGCWDWTGTESDPGVPNHNYGVLVSQGVSHFTHRLSWEIHKGKIPKGMHVLHACDRPICCNPAHLWLGTMADNCHDRDTKKRQVAPRGDRHGMSKLTTEKVLKIRELYCSGTSLADLSKQFEIGITTIHRAATKRTWAHV